MTKNLKLNIILGLIFSMGLFHAGQAQSTTPYEAAQARYKNIMAHRTPIKRRSIHCLPMWCEHFNAHRDNAAIQTARERAKVIEKSHRNLLKEREKAASNFQENQNSDSFIKNKLNELKQNIKQL